MNSWPVVWAIFREICTALSSKMEQTVPMADDTALIFGLTWIQDERKQQVGLLVDADSIPIEKAGQ